MRCQALASSSYHIIMFCFYYHAGTQGRMRWRWRWRDKTRAREKERGVSIKWKSITYRKQFSLAQVERKLEKSWKNMHQHTQECAHTHTHCGWGGQQEIGQSGSTVVPWELPSLPPIKIKTLAFSVVEQYNQFKSWPLVSLKWKLVRKTIQWTSAEDSSSLLRQMCNNFTLCLSCEQNSNVAKFMGAESKLNQTAKCIIRDYKVQSSALSTVQHNFNLTFKVSYQSQFWPLNLTSRNKSLNDD